MSDDDAAPQKMHSGYHGWMKSIAKTEQDFTPVRIESSATAVAAPSSSSQQGNSAWNHAGTWEEKDKSVWARDRLKELILTGFAITDDARKVSIKASAIVECEGDAKIVFSRGKKRCGYDITLKFEWSSTHTDEKEDEVTGHVELHDFDDTSGEEYEVHITTEGRGKHGQAAKQAIQSWEPELRQLLAAWKSELLQQ